MPKRDPDLGWTINLSHRHGRLALYAVWAAALLPMTVGLAILAETRFG